MLWWLEQGLLVLLLAVLVGLSFFQVLLLNLAKLQVEWASRASIALIWGDSFLRHLVLAIAFLGASLATREGRHLSIDALPRMLAPRARMLLRAAMDLLSCGICLLLAHAAGKLILFDSGSVAFRIGLREIPRWPFYLSIAVGFALVALRFVIRGAMDLYGGWTGEVGPEVQGP